MNHPRHVCCTIMLALTTLVLALGLTSGRALGASQDAEEEPSLSLKATPPVGFTPLRIRFAGDLRGGADDAREFYCLTVSWDWGDGTVSETSEDCDPYEPGKVTIRRRFATTHIFRQGGSFLVRLRLKQRDEVVANATVNVQVRGGLGDGFGD